MNQLPNRAAFDRTKQEAVAAPSGNSAAMTNHAQRMGRAEWALLAALGLIWGSAFLFIKVAVGSFDPLTYVWLRLTFAAAALAMILRISGRTLRLPLVVWASVGLLALLNNVVPFLLFG